PARASAKHRRSVFPGDGEISEERDAQPSRRMSDDQTPLGVHEAHVAAFRAERGWQRRSSTVPSTRRSIGTAVPVLLATALQAGSLLPVLASAKGPKPQPCPSGRYLIVGEPPVAGTRSMPRRAWAT